jgi:hypothetical protein
LSLLNDAVVGFSDILIECDRTDGVGNDMATGGIFDMFDVSTDVSLDSGILEDTITSFVEGTVLQDEVISIA